MPYTNGKAAHIRARWIEGEALRQLRFGLTYRQIAARKRRLRAEQPMTYEAIAKALG